MRLPRPKTEWLTLTAILAAGGGLIAAPPSIQSRVVTTVRDAAEPLQSRCRWTCERIESNYTAWRKTETAAIPTADVSELENELVQWKSRARASEAIAAELREEIARRTVLRASPYQGQTGEPLFISELVSAAVLGEENAALCRGAKLLRAGTADQVAESSLVLEDERPLLDQGADAGLAAGQDVFAGRSVLGRVARVGRWVSTLQPITDPEFRGLAQIIRRSDQGPVFAAKGLLEGHADGFCRLKHVPATEAVAEGDEVYTGERDANCPHPMWYGTIVKAEIPPGSPHWEIHVRPGAGIEQARTVHVLRKKANPVRMLAQ